MEDYLLDLKKSSPPPVGDQIKMHISEESAPCPPARHA
jgi:hypothetical protein